MNGVTVDPEARTMRVQGGAKFLEVFPVTQAHGLAPLSGSAPHVGVVGYTLGGGYGLMGRKYGLAVDSVCSVEMVLASGEIVTASATENPDLFWAVRGGGGAYGVITEIEMALYPEGTVFGGATIYPAVDLEEILNAFTAWSKTMPDEVTSAIQIMNLPPAPFIPEPLRGQCVVAVNACVCGGLENPEELVAPIRNLGPAIMDMWGPIPYTESGIIFNDPVDPMPAIARGLLLSDMDAEMVGNLMAGNGPAHQSPLTIIQLRHLGGQISRVDHAATAVGCRRDANYLIYTIAVPHPMAPPEAIHAHTTRMFEALDGHTVCPGPLNFLGEGTVEAKTIRELFTNGDYERLREVKSAYDPENAFPYASLGLSE
ncbi:FAD-binding oxidoreductase [soil metagenome]